MEHNEQIQAYQKTLFPFDPVILLLDGLRKWALILVIALICGMGAYVFTDISYVPEYRTEATLVLTTRDSGTTVFHNLDSTSSLAAVFSEILNSSLMRNKVLEALQTDSLVCSIHAAAIESTNLLTVQVISPDPRTAFRVMDVLLKNHEAVTYSVMGDIVLEVLEPPTVPVEPFNERNASAAFLTTAMAVGMGMFVLLVIMSYFTDVIRSGEEAEQKLDCWCLGELPHEHRDISRKGLLRGNRSGIRITRPDTGFRYVNAVGRLCRRVEQHMGAGRLVMVTSVMEGEGKTTVSVNLALAMAKKHERVLLIDLDLRRPSCCQIMEQGEPQHFTNDVLEGKVKLEDAVNTDKLSRMDMLFARGCEPQTADDLLHAQGLEELLRQARERYGYVVIDLPPMAAAPDPEVVMEYADGCLLVIRQNAARTSELNRAIRELQRGRAKLLGCVLNDVRSTEAFIGEGYGIRWGGNGAYGRSSAYGDYQKPE